MIVSIIGGLIIRAGGAAWDWWKGKKKDVEEVKGRPTTQLATASRPLLDECVAKLAAELAKTPRHSVTLPDRAAVKLEIQKILSDFNFSEADAERVADAMADAVQARLRAAE